VPIATLAAALLLGSIYQSIGQAADRSAFPPPGRLVPFNGGEVHLHCTGQGGPTIVLQAGAMWFAQTWHWIQRELSATNRVCSYDRAGLGWSDVPQARHDGLTIARDLKDLLAQSAEAGPYVLVGHSLGGMFALIFAGLYPEGTLALGLIDPAHPDELKRPQSRAEHEQLEGLLGVAAMLAHTGLLRIANPIARTLRGLPEPAYRTGAMFFSSPRHLRNARAELAQWDRTMDAARQVANLGNRPLAVISATASLSGTDEAMRTEQQRHNQLTALSQRGQHVLIPGANHLTLLTNEGYARQTAAVLRALIANARVGYASLKAPL
jgi:pimeloyl-ACP methyl ester carboxylesterase